MAVEAHTADDPYTRAAAVCNSLPSPTTTANYPPMQLELYLCQLIEGGIAHEPMPYLNATDAHESFSKLAEIHGFPRLQNESARSHFDAFCEAEHINSDNLPTEGIRPNTFRWDKYVIALFHFTLRPVNSTPIVCVSPTTPPQQLNGHHHPHQGDPRHGTN